MRIDGFRAGFIGKGRCAGKWRLIHLTAIFDRWISVVRPRSPDSSDAESANRFGLCSSFREPPLTHADSMPVSLPLAFKTSPFLRSQRAVLHSVLKIMELAQSPNNLAKLVRVSAFAVKSESAESLDDFRDRKAAHSY